jgi:perosamine synthetase
MISHNRPTLGIEEEEAALRVIRSGHLAQGREVSAFEDEFCRFLGLSQGHAIAVSSGTAALFMALWSVNARNKTVAFPVYVCSALRNAVSMAGAKQCLLDTAEGSPNIDFGDIGKKIFDIAILPHMFGIPIAVDESQEVIIEDCCQSLGATVNEKATGLYGDLGIFSFYATKLMTSGGHGGMVVSKQKKLVDRIRDYREFDCRKDTIKRFNFHMTELQAAVGREQLRKLPAFLKRREEIFRMYQEAGLDLLDVKEEDMGNLKPIRYRTILKTEHQKKIIQRLKSKNIKAIIPIEDWELLGDPPLFPNAREMTKQTVSLPCYPSLTDAEVDQVAQAVRHS